MALPPALPPGTVIGGHYIVDNLVNSGGFGAVYRAIDTSEGNRLCALKESYNVTPAARRQALMEASVLFTVRSRHLPEVYDALEANGRFYLVMELIEGQNLLQLVRSRVPGGIVGEQLPYRQQVGPCSEQEVLEWLLPIIDILQELHSRSNPILHRDIKPGNIILRPDHSAVLVDFGLTRLYDPRRDTGTLARAVTEGFSPPEQYIGRTVPQSDIYSLAATMYLLLTNRVPPLGLQRSVNDALIPPRQLNPSLSPRMENALLKALAVQFGLRYQTMREFGDALREPPFTGYSDQTIAAPVQSTGTQPALAQAPLRLPAPSAPTITQTAAPYPQPPVSHPTAYSPGYGPVSYSPPLAGYTPAPPSYPYQQPSYAPIPQPMIAPVTALPSPSGQGCLWGLIQGLLAGIIVVFTPDQGNFYLAIIMGFAFYLLAGFITTRRGGGALRGGWAGFWSGIISTITFWTVYGVCYAVLWIQAAQLLSQEHVPADKIWERARESIHTALPPSSPTDARTGLINLAVVASIGLLLAYGLGLVGGLLGNSRYKAWWNRKVQQQQLQQQRAHP
ncbi:MAG: protein kinase [Ktedonobacteraceae bacterium]|nr:protein kinase [Ktedonobacteraceae bacterium]MBO0792941.1 protein kinase [Ktedonobacteraceae bacterium]